MKCKTELLYVFRWYVCFILKGTLFAACELMKKQRAEVLGCLVVIQLSDLGGADKLNPHTLFSLVQY